MKEQIEVITYEQDRLNYFTDLMKKAQERYKRLFKKHKDAPYLSEEAQALSDAGRETHFLGDVVEMLEKGYRKQREWISVEDRLPNVIGKYICCVKNKDGNTWTITADYSPEMKTWFGQFGEVKNTVTHWMPLPEPPEMKGGAE